MDDRSQYMHRFASRLQRFLPLPAHARPTLFKSIRKLLPGAISAPSCLVTNIFYAGIEHGIMCRLELPASMSSSSTLIASITHISFDRRHPISDEISRYRKRRHEPHCDATVGSSKIAKLNI